MLKWKLRSHTKRQGREPLSRDQIIEVVHETLQTAATTSDEQKLASLKNGLGYTMLAEDSFERKQLFLQVLRNSTSLELAVLKALYESGDPYFVREGHPLADDAMARHISAASTYSVSLYPQGYWQPVGNTTDCGQPALLKLLSDRVRSDEAATEGVVRLLDGKGLAKGGPNLERNDCKVAKWIMATAGSVVYVGQGSYASGIVRETPVEASQTHFGRDFIRFCRGG